MLLDDRPSHPMVIVARFDFADGPPPHTLGDAFAATVGQEPLLTARIARGQGRPRWLPAALPRLTHTKADSAPSASATVAHPLPRIDFDTGPMLHASVVTHPAGWSIVVAVHHAACDGLGLVQFMDRWLLAAAGKASRRPRALADALAALHGRGRVAGSWLEFSRMLPKFVKGLEGVKQFVARDVVDLGRGAAAMPSTARDAAAADWLPTVIASELDEHLVEQLEARALAAEVMVNDLLMAAVVTTLGEHVVARALPAEAGSWIRLTTPMSLRTKSDHVLPAVNRVSMVFLDRRPGEQLDIPQLVRSFKDEMDVIRSHSLGHIFPLSLAAARLLPGGLRRATSRSRPQSTAVLSNLGRCFQRSPLIDAAGHLQVGESRLAGWWIVPPIRPGTALAAATHETMGRRTIAFHIDADRVPVAVAHSLIRRMNAMIRALAERDAMSSRREPAPA